MAGAGAYRVHRLLRQKLPQLRPASRRHAIPYAIDACKCGADEAEKIVTGQELVEIYKAMQSGKPTKEQNDKLERMKAAGIACAAPGARP